MLFLSNLEFFVDPDFLEFDIFRDFFFIKYGFFADPDPDMIFFSEFFLSNLELLLTRIF